MTEPTELQKSLVDQTTYLRGRIITSYSQVEFFLADISVRLNLKFPYLIKDRIKAVRGISERHGYEVYKEDLTKVCDELLQYDELRNFMAHGFMILTTDKKDNHELEFRLYQREDREKFQLITIKTTVPYLKAAAEQITEYVSHAVQLFGRIYLDQKLKS
jgi:hypothetical protein